MFLVPFFDLQNFILLVRTVPFLRKIFFISSYTAKNNYFLLYELIQDLPYSLSVRPQDDRLHNQSLVFLFLNQNFSTKTYDVDIQKKCLNEIVLLKHSKHTLTRIGKKLFKILA